ncbi:MAG: hypothetical protein V3V16_01790 [Melioribacteraceae bacterium]
MDKIKYQIYVVLLLSVFNIKTFAQIKTNVEVVQSLLVNVTDDIRIQDFVNDNNKIELKFVAADNYEILRTKLIETLQKNNFSVVNESNNKLSFTLSDAKINYKNIFRDGILGEYLLEREANLVGSYYFETGNEIGKVNNFSLSTLDTVKYSDVNELENIAYSFSTAKLPSEPFFSSILEPVIAVGTAAVAVFLFFNVRSK